MHCLLLRLTLLRAMFILSSGANMKAGSTWQFTAVVDFRAGPYNSATVFANDDLRERRDEGVW